MVLIKEKKAAEDCLGKKSMLMVGRRRGRMQGNEGGKKKYHHSHHSGRVRRLDAFLLVSPGLVWLIMHARYIYIYGWIAGMSEPCLAVAKCLGDREL